MSSDHIHFEELASIDSADITANFKVINASGFSLPCTILYITNNSDITVKISYDGVNEHDYILMGTSVDIKYTISPFYGMLKQGTKVYVKLSDNPPKAAKGRIYISGTIDKV